MPAFEVYIDDDRYKVPSFYLVEARDEAAAWRLAGDLWRNSGHHRGVELRRDGVRLRGDGSMSSEDGDGEADAAAS
jgi:hypothetical protein